MKVRKLCIRIVWRSEQCIRILWQSEQCASGLREGLTMCIRILRSENFASGRFYGTTYDGQDCASSVRSTPPSRGFVFNKSDTIFALARFNSHKNFLRFDNCFNLFAHCHENFNSREARQRSSITAMLPPFDTQTSNFVPTVVSVVVVIPSW